MEAYKQQVEQVHIRLSMCMHQTYSVHMVYMTYMYMYILNSEFVWRREVVGEYIIILYMNRNIHFSLIHMYTHEDVLVCIFYMYMYVALMQQAVRGQNGPGDC